MSGSRSVRSLKAYQKRMSELGRFHLVVPAGELMRADLGLSNPLVEGEAVMPPPRGRVADFNANGRQITRKDLPKVDETFTMWASWNDWHGNPHSGIRVVTRAVYQKEQVPPPGEYLTVRRGTSGLLGTSRLLTLEAGLEADVLHVVNLFLELFGTFELVGEDLAASTVQVRRLNWKVLPRGRFPFARARESLSEFLSALPPSSRPVVEDRIQSITRYEPDLLAIGTGGFTDYVVFGFTEANIYVLESHRLGNATYVLRSNWEDVSQLSKRQILDGSLHEARVIHNLAWRRSMAGLLTSRP